MRPLTLLKGHFFRATAIHTEQVEAVALIGIEVETFRENAFESSHMSASESRHLLSPLAGRSDSSEPNDLSRQVESNERTGCRGMEIL